MATPQTDPRKKAKGVTFGPIKPIGDEDDPADLDDITPLGTVEELEDGSAIVHDDDEPSGDQEFYENLADGVIDESKLDDIASRYIDLIEKDVEARKKRDEQYEEGIRRTGLGKDAPGGAQFDGASKVVHPVMGESCVDFSARMMKELFPPDGPVKSKIVGKPDEKKLAKADRKKTHMNLQLTEQIKEFRDQLEQLLTQEPLSGSAYLALYWSEQHKRPIPEFIPIDHIHVPFSAGNFYTAQRVTWDQYITEQEYENRVKSGFYRDTEIYTASQAPEQTKAAKATDKVEGKSESAYNEDGLRLVHLVFTALTIDDDKFGKKSKYPVPYAMSIDATSGKVLALYRNWAERDENFEKLDHIVEFKFIPWRGAYGVGLPHLIGGMSAALTGALRALLDTAHINNTASAIKLKSRTGGQSTQIDPTQVSEIEGSGLQDDIRKVVMPLPFNPPSPVLFELLGWLTDAAKGVVTTAEEKIADATNSMPVGTAQALIEQGSQVFSAIHARQHASMHKVLEILHRINRDHLDDEVVLEDYGDQIVTRADYEGPMDVLPVSDPHIFSETQRVAQNQMVQQLAEKYPDKFNIEQMLKRILRSAKVPNYEELMLNEPDPEELNPVTENLKMLRGEPAFAFPDQDHLAHIEVLMQVMTSPLFGQNPIFAPKFLPRAIEHLGQHMSLWYVQAFTELIQQTAGVEDVAQFFDPDPRVQKRLSMVLAAAAGHVTQESMSVFEKIPPAIQQGMALLKSLAPPMPQDPTVAAAQAAQAETQRKAADDQAQQKLGADELALKKQGQDQQAQNDAAELQAKHEQIAADQQAKTDATRAKLATNEQDNLTAQTIATEKINFDSAKGLGSFENGNSLATGPNPEVTP